MKRTLSLFLSVALILTLTACGSKAGQDGTGSNPVPEKNTPTSTNPTPEIPPGTSRRIPLRQRTRHPQGRTIAGRKF